MDYYQISIRLKDCLKIGFVTHDGHFEFLRMLFRLTNAPRIFQMVMYKILDYLSLVCIFIDDVLIFSDTYNEHIKHVQTVLDLLLSNGA